MREVYEIRGFDFTLCCGINNMYDLEFGESLVQRLSGIADLSIKIDRMEKRPDKRLRLRKWRGEIKGLKDAYVAISEVRNYLTRVSLDFNEEDSEKLSEIRAILKGINVRSGGKKTFLECRVGSEIRPKEKKPVKPDYFSKYRIYSSN